MPRALFALIFVAAGALAAPNDTHRVVVLYDERTDLPGIAAIDESLIRTLVAGSPTPIEIYRENMDLSRVGSPSYSPVLRDFLRAKYAGKTIDLAIAVMGPSLDFLLRYGDDVFPAAPIVFAGLDARELRGHVLPARATGVMVSREFAPTLELALKLHPDTKNIAFIAGTSEFDSRLVDEARVQLRAYAGRFDFVYLTALPLKELLTEVSRLPPHTIVLFSTFFRDAAGETFVPHEVVERVAAAANAPVYGFLDQYLGHGIVGGRLYSVSAHGEAAARLALQILAGKPPADLARVTIGAGETMFDWRQLQRWGISESQLPPDAVVRFRPPSIWSQYHGYVFGAILIFILQALLIGGLLLQLSRRRRAEAALNESEQRMSLAAEAIELGIWGWNPATGEIWATRECRALFGIPPESAITLDAFTNQIHPQERQAMRIALDKISREGGRLELETRVSLPQGNVRWIAVRGKTVDEPHGRPRQFLSVCVDITSRKSSEQAARQHLNEIAHMTRVSTMGELSATLSHEINQPLMAILTNAQAAQRFMAHQPPAIAELDEILQDIVDADRRASAIIRRMRTFMKKGEPEFSSVDLGEVMTDVAKLVRSDAIQRNLQVALQFDRRLPRVACDSIQIQQVTLNLLMNAFDAMSEVPTAGRQVIMRLDGDGTDMAKITISDCGIGLAPDTLKQMFTPFYTTKSRGLGMGLAISQSIIEAHGGRIWAENNAERGAAFYFTLPLAERRFGAHVSVK